MKNLVYKKQWLYHIEKKPMNPNSDYKASGDPTDPAKWSDYDTAEAACKRFGGTGMGIAFGDGLAGIDIDAHGIPKNPLQDEILDMFAGTYIECSPSGKGRHILFYVDYGTLNDRGYINDELEFVGYANKKRSIDIETYITKRYFTWTGTADEEHFTTYDVNDMTEQYMAFLDKYMRDEKPTYQAPTQQYHVELDMSTEDILAKARTHANGAKFIALYDNGDLSAYGNDHSAADLALCNMLAWYLGKDADKIDAAFQDSALMRDKWLERHGNQTYGEMTIAAAIEGTQGQYDPFGAEKGATMHTNAENPSESLSEPQKGDIFDMDVLRYELAQRNINMRYNNMTQELVIDGLPDYVDPDRAIEYIITELYGDMRRKYKYASLSIIGTLVNALAVDMRIQYHPVLEYFKGKKWDKFDHLGRLYETLGIENDELSQILVRKWFMQGWALLYNDPKKPYGADGVLTFAGPQGIGKTSFFKVMSINDADWFGEGQSITSDKDTRMRALSVWICELGEIGCTFKSDMDDLKNFITAPKDRYRRHYAASDTKALRRTNLGGTVNGTEFLIDQTGNRRFWTVPLGDKNIAPLLYDETITNPEQIWLQVWEEYCEGEDLHTCFRLTDEQQKMLAERNGKCEKPIEGEEQIKAIFDDALSFDWMTLRDWMNRHDLRGQIREKNVRAILDKFGATVQDKKIDGKSKSVRWLPR